MYYSMPQPYNAMMNEGIVYEAAPAAEASSNQSAEVSAVCTILRVSIMFGACFHCYFGHEPQYERWQGNSVFNYMLRMRQVSV
jgi:hypothetical protein